MSRKREGTNQVGEAGIPAPTVSRFLRSIDRRRADGAPTPSGEAAPLVGEVLDTHNPDFRGRVLVRWLSERGESCERWLGVVRGPAPRRGDRVLLVKPANWPDALVTDVIDGPFSRQPADPQPQEAGETLKLEQDEKLCVMSADGKPLVEVFASTQGPVVRLMHKDVDLEIPGKLRIRAETLEMEGGRGGIEIRSEADTIVRGRYIRLN